MQRGCGILTELCRVGFRVGDGGGEPVAQTSRDGGAGSRAMVALAILAPEGSLQAEVADSNPNPTAAGGDT